MSPSIIIGLIGAAAIGLLLGLWASIEKRAWLAVTGVLMVLSIAGLIFTGPPDNFFSDGLADKNAIPLTAMFLGLLFATCVLTILIRLARQGSGSSSLSLGD